jgi:hypothetical protein
LGARDAVLEFTDQLEVIGYVDPVDKVVPDPPLFNANEAVTEYDEEA